MKPNDTPPPTDDPEANNAAGAGCMARLVRLVVEMREALEANRVFHTPLELRKHGGDWNEFQLDAIHRTRDALINVSSVSLPNVKRACADS